MGYLVKHTQHNTQQNSQNGVCRNNLISSHLISSHLISSSEKGKIMYTVRYIVNFATPDASDITAWFNSSEAQQLQVQQYVTPEISDALIFAAQTISKFDYAPLGGTLGFGSITLAIHWFESPSDPNPYFHFMYYTEMGIVNT